MKTLVIVIFALSTAPPFAFYICYAALHDRRVPPRFLRIYAALLVAILSIFIASVDGVDLAGAIGVQLRGFISFVR